MERYNPPSTSQQAVCHGCIRQIRKVQEVMNENYVLQMTAQIHERRMEEYIGNLENQLRVENIQKKNLKLVFDSKVAGMRGPAASGDEAMNLEMERLRAANEQLVKELEKLKTAAKKEPSPHPIEQWKEDLEQYYSDKYDKVKDFISDKNDEIQNLKREVTRQNFDMRNCKRTIKVQNNLIERLKEEICELKEKLFEEELEEEIDMEQESGINEVQETD